jgi:two-component system sensor histidine kinase HydH
VEVDVDIPRRDSVLADRGMLRRAIVNLTLNAIDAMPDGGDLLFTGVACQHAYELEIADSGPGLSDEALQRACEPFYTTKSTGTGLGLAIVCRIAEAHGGEVQARNCAIGGASFTLRLPQTQYMEAAA